MRKLARLMFRPIDEQNVRLGNALDVYLKITLLQNIHSHQKIMKNGKINCILMKILIMHVTTAKIRVTKRFTHLWHVCLAMTNVQVKIMVTVRN